MCPGIRKFAIELRKRTPASERWFMDTAKELGFQFWQGKYFRKGYRDRFNIPLYGRFIPDFHNLKCKFIVEVDGSYHNLPAQIEKDKRKDFFYKKWGFRVFRVKAYDLDGLKACLLDIEVIRNDKITSLPRKSQAFLSQKQKEWDHTGVVRRKGRGIFQCETTN